MNGVEQLSTCGVPMLKSTVSSDSQNNIFSYSLGGHWSPSDLRAWHWIFHVCVKLVTLFSGKNVENLDGTITATLSNILVLWIESDTETLVLKGTNSKFM
jgi:hypothetical protein